MGNQLAGIAPQQIHPVEYYLTELTNTELLSYDANLGSTRFLKVARVKLHQTRPALSSTTSGNASNYSGFGPPALGVAKVFVIHDPSLPVKSYREKLEKLQSQLAGNPNALPFSKIILNEKAGIMLRQYVKYNLYDRLSTRPFMTFFEKKWIAFQLLKCCQWLHRQQICHGDLKLENILITSNQWVLISDFAPFKPTTLPDDNPGDFSYFFDTSRRRTCNLAPERFVSDTETDIDLGGEELTPQMDLFSLGCVFAELFTEASNFELFDLSSLLAYRKQKNLKEVHSKIDSIADQNFRKLIMNLIDIDPTERNSSTQHLHEMTSNVFPNYFTILYDYFKELIFCAPDEKILRLNADLNSLIRPVVKEDSNGMLLILTMITSSLRALKHVHAKITALRLICRIILTDSETMSVYVLDRVLPYLLSMLNDNSSPTVRREAIDCLTLTLEQVSNVQTSDNNVFPDYILPVLIRIVNDKAPFVRQNLAANLGRLAHVSKKFLDASNDINSKLTELEVLRDTFQTIISYLLTDQDNSVRRTLLMTDISTLCEFLGQTRTNDVILSHIITFLNNKYDFELRCSFFDNVIHIATFLGQSCSKILKPLLQQGLSDSEETVIHKTLLALAEMTTRQVLDRGVIFELIVESVPLLGHPNLWIRHSLVAFIMALSRQLTLAEVNCKLIPLIKPFLNHDVHILSEELILDSLKPPLSRYILNLIMLKNNPNQVDLLFECLKEKKLLRSLPRHHGNPSLSHTQSSVLFERLSAEKFDETVEDQLLCLADIIKRIARNYNSKGNEAIQSFHDDGSIVLTRKSRKCHAVSLSDDRFRTVHITDDWRNMFSPDQPNVSGDISSATLIETNEDSSTIPIAREALDQLPGHHDCPPCANELINLINRKKDEYELCTWLTGEKAKTNSKWGTIVTANARPRGMLIAHLHEHSKSVNQLIALGRSSLFVSCGSDGLIKTWDTSKIEDAKAPINKARQTTTSSDSSPVEGMTYLAALDTLLSYTTNGILHVHRIDSASNRLRLLQTNSLAGDDKLSSVTDLINTTPFGYMVSYSNSLLLGYDMRQTITAPSLKLNIDQRDGFVTALDGNDYCVFAATSSGAVYVFDIRFGIQANVLRYPDRKRIRKLLYTEHGLFASVKGNNEVTLFDCESGSRQKTLWASKAPALSTQRADSNSTPDSVLGMVLLNTHSTSGLITAGSDMRLRFWDFKNSASSVMLSDGLRPHHNGFISSQHSHSDIFTYSSKFVDGIEVFLEDERRNGQSSANISHSIELQTVSTAHKDTISDLVWIEQSRFLVSSSKDGVIKLWK